MEINHIRAFQIRINDHLHFPLRVVDQTERRNRPRFQIQVLPQAPFRGETQPVFPQFPGQPLDIRGFGLFHHHQIVAAAFFIAQEQIFAMNPGKVTGVLPGFLHSIYRRMFDALIFNAQIIQIFQDFTGPALVMCHHHG